MAGQTLPDWNIGFSGVTSDFGERQVRELLEFLASLSSEVGRRFVVGTWVENEIGTRDIVFVDREGAPEQAVPNILTEACQ